DLQRQVALYRDQVRDLRLSNESNQAKLFDHSQHQGELYCFPSSTSFFLLHYCTFRLAC
ncbi:uncharacterized protein F5147DRAFT_587598, partial [Suillus discolor]